MWCDNAGSRLWEIWTDVCHQRITVDRSCLNLLPSEACSVLGANLLKQLHCQATVHAKWTTTYERVDVFRPTVMIYSQWNYLSYIPHNLMEAVPKFSHSQEQCWQHAFTGAYEEQAGKHEENKLNWLPVHASIELSINSTTHMCDSALQVNDHPSW